jgi:hypothetical protein
MAKKIISDSGKKKILEKEDKTNHLDYVDNFIQNEYNKTSNYPVFLEFSKESINKMKAELEEINLSDSWFDDWPGNYRGIKIKIIKKEKKK